MRRFLQPIVVAGGLVAASGPALAADTVRRPYRGVTWLHRRTTAPLSAHVLTVDLCADGVSVRATAPGERRKTVSAFGRGIVNAVAAVNGDFFTPSDNYRTTGLAIGNGRAWPDTRNDGFESSIAFGPQRAEVLPGPAARNPGAWVRELVSSRPMILKDGVVQRGFTTGTCAGSVTAAGDCARDPRTGVGLSQDRRTLVLAVVDGRQSGWSRGMSTYELATLMKSRGAWDAVNMDSGGSAQMWIKGQGVVNRPSDGRERVVANHLAVRVGPPGAPGAHCPPVDAADAGVPLPADAGAPLDPVDAGMPLEPDAGPADAGEADASEAWTEPDAGESDAGEPWQSPGDAAVVEDAPDAGLDDAPDLDDRPDETVPEGGCDCGSNLAPLALLGLAARRRR
jgi:hypothetical protein